MPVQIALVTRGIALAFGIATLTALAACSSNDGRTMRPPDPTTQSGEIVAESTTSGVSTISGFVLSSEAVSEAGVLDAEHSCSGANTSPPLRWEGTPADAASLALVLRDLDATRFAHWVVWGVDRTTGGLTPGAAPPGAAQAMNGTGEVGWFGPCPPEGETHQYVLTLYALSAPVTLADGAPGEDAIAAIEAVATAQTELRFSFPEVGN